MKKTTLFFFLFFSLFLTFSLAQIAFSQGQEPKQLSELKNEICRIIKVVQEEIVPYVGGFALIVAGIIFMFSGADPKLHNQAKEALIYIAVGLLVIWGAAELIKAIVGFDIC